MVHRSFTEDLLDLMIAVYTVGCSLVYQNLSQKVRESPTTKPPK